MFQFIIYHKAAQMKSTFVRDKDIFDLWLRDKNSRNIKAPQSTTNYNNVIWNILQQLKIQWTKLLGQW